MLRATARCLVLWDSVGTSHAWLQNQMPEFLRGSLPDLVKEWAALPVGDGQSRASAHVHLLAGLALGMGLRYAGTQDSSAASTLLDLAEKLLALKASLPEPGPGRAPRQLVSKQDLESALCTVMQSACCVLAGSGDVRAMRLGDWGHCAACILFSCNLNLHADCAKWNLISVYFWRRLTLQSVPFFAAATCLSFREQARRVPSLCGVRWDTATAWQRARLLVFCS